MKSEGLLPHSQELPTCHCHEPDKSGPCPHSTSRRSILILSFNLRLGFPSGLFSSSVPHQNSPRICLAPHTCHIPSPSHFPDFIARNIFSAEFRYYSSSLCSLLHSPLTSSFLGPNILHSALFCKISP